MTLNTISPNAHELIVDHDLVILFSYATPVAAKCGKEVFTTEQKFSRATDAHVASWTRGHAVKRKSQMFFDSLK